ncbi:rhomboid family intramembrane serine protease [Micromonospora endolithica]|uniref:Rhomboid family intramembrane serine protease n=1 Tax=Micromonospora endolithica TaxID=230091 RepID=A0A3A9ZQS9_9ACTN|nr:rhomboid family intramembrane serine protease [Micromonospora endolithica]RKN50533.1 rhomboid family intramembrane serine protease [Micromonospora endolithica]TWJ20762.1 membrane associated rhomboid family serine protease [Micromonospora endolithica]
MDTTSTPPAGPPAADTPTTCFRHPRRETYLRCTRCDRYICPDCMREAPVGFRCPVCVKEDNRTVREARTVFGGRTVTAPLVTYALIALNVLAYLVELAVPGVVDLYYNIGAALVDADGAQYVDDGTPYPGFDQVGVLHGEWYRLVTSAFLHSLPGEGIFGIAHILLNMYWLWVLGRVLEERLGHVRLVAVYLLSAVGGSVLAILVDPGQAALGASGAVFGLAACYFVLTRKLRHHPLDGNRLMLMFVLWLVLSATFTSWEGHLGGLLAGGVTGAGLAYAPRERRAAVQALVVAGVALILAVLVILKSLQFTG